MTEKTGKEGGKRRGRTISSDEQRLWEYATQDVARTPVKRGADSGDSDPADAPLSVSAKDTGTKDTGTGRTTKRDAGQPAKGGRGDDPMSPPFQGAPQAPTYGRAPEPDQSPELDHRTHSRLRKGRIPIEAVLDLHGMTQPDAHAALSTFIQAAHATQKRCVLVITGKGGDRVRSAFPSDFTGVLRQRLPEWLGQMPLRPLVLKCEPARRQHGGDGAFYVYIKRLRGD